MLRALLAAILEITVGKNLVVAAAVSAFVVLAGCTPRYADTPTPTRFANEEQHKLQSARHWQLIADNFAEQMASSLANKLDARAIHIPQPGGEQPFVEGFRELLMTSLFAKGVPVATSPNGALIADVRFNAYRFQPDRAANTRFYGEATALAAGLWAVGGVMAADIASAGGVDAGAKLLLTVAGLEGFGWLRNEGFGAGRYASGNVPQSEILLTVSVSDGGRLLSRHSSIYYSADEDMALYWKRSGGGSVVQVVGDCGSGEVKCKR